MNLTQADLPYLKWSLSVFLFTLVMGGSAVFFSQKYDANSQLARRAAQQQLNDARSKLSAARSDLENMAAYTQEYAAIQRRGIVDEEKRLDLIESLETLRKRNRVLDFKYTIAPQQAYKPTPALDTGNFELKISNMTMQLELLHEEQLVNFFSSLRHDTNGWFILDKCSLEKSTTGIGQLKADCTGGWLTMKNRNGK